MALEKVGKKYSGIFKNELKNGDVSYYYTYKDLTGKKYRVKVGLKSSGITPTYVKNKRDEQINMIRNGEDPIADKKKNIILFSEVWHFYIENKGMEKTTKDDRKGRYTKHMKEYFSNEVTVDNLKRFRVDKKDVLSATSIDMLMAFTGTAINFWNTEQKLLMGEGRPYKASVYNPLPDLRASDKHRLTKKEKVHKIRRERFLNTDEIRVLKTAVADKPDLNLFVHLALSTGARLSTIFSITKHSIRDSKVTLINHKVGNEKYFGYIEPQTQYLLDKVLPKLKASDTLFAIEKRQLQRRLQYIMNNLFNEGLKGKDPANRVVVHTLRHTFASHLVMKGVPLVKVKELMSHKDISATMIYSHLAPDAGKEDVMNLWL